MEIDELYWEENFPADFEGPVRFLVSDDEELHCQEFDTVLRFEAKTLDAAAAGD